MGISPDVIEKQDRSRANRKAIVALSGLTEELLDECAIELQTDLEMFEFEEGKQRDAPVSPEALFEAFAAHEEYGLDFSTIDGSSLADLDAPSVYLVAAWNFNSLTKEYSLSSQSRKDGWTKEGARIHALSYFKAVDYLIGRALVGRTYRNGWL